MRISRARRRLTAVIGGGLPHIPSRLLPPLLLGLGGHHLDLELLGLGCLCLLTAAGGPSR